MLTNTNQTPRLETEDRKGGYLIAGRPASENIWKRAWDDTLASLTRLFWVVEAILTGASVILVTILIDDTVMRAVVPATIFTGVLMLHAVTAVCGAPFKQRNEARKEIIRIREQQEPKLSISRAEVQQMPPYYSDFDRQMIMPFALRIQIENAPDVTAENCVAELLDIKPVVEWKDLIEGDRTLSYGGNDFVGYDVPFPMPLQWSANEEPKIDINARNRALLDICYYNDADDRITLAFTSEDLRNKYRLPATDVVLSVRIDSKDCLPIYCVCKYKPNPLILEIGDQCVIAYIGPERPDLNDYREFKTVPRPAEWDEVRTT